MNFLNLRPNFTRSKTCTNFCLYYNFEWKIRKKFSVPTIPDYTTTDNVVPFPSHSLSRELKEKKTLKTVVSPLVAVSIPPAWRLRNVVTPPRALLVPPSWILGEYNNSQWNCQKQNRLHFFRFDIKTQKMYQGDAVDWTKKFKKFRSFYKDFGPVYPGDPVFIIYPRQTFIDVEKMRQKISFGINKISHK